jgi:regulator of protease activity HflC (stomatin/prohibitin superfamily)
MSNSINFNTTLGAIVLIAALILLVWLLLRWMTKSGGLFTTVYEWERGLLYVNGRFQRELPAGRYVSRSPLAHRDILTVRLTEQVHQSAVVDVVSQDKLVFRLAAQAKYRVVDARTAYENNHAEQIGLSIRAALVRIAAERTLEAFIGDRSASDAALLSMVTTPIAGCEITFVLINVVTLPPELRRLFAEIERAKLEGQAALERARGEHAALRSLANAAGLLKDNPDLMNLRLLQSVGAASGKGQLTLVVGQDGLAAGRSTR